MAVCDSGLSGESGCWERGGLLKNPTAAIVLRLRPALSLAGGKSLKELHSALKTIPYGKKQSAALLATATRSCELCRGLRVGIRALYCGND